MGAPASPDDGHLVRIADLDAGDLVVLERATSKELRRVKLDAVG